MNDTRFNCPKCDWLVTGIYGLEEEGHAVNCGYYLDHILYDKDDESLEEKL